MEGLYRIVKRAVCIISEGMEGREVSAWLKSSFLILDTQHHSPHLSFSLVSCVLLLLAILLLSCYFYYVKGVQYSYSSKQLPPGSLGLPLLLGETIQFAFWNTCPIGSPPPFLSSRLRKYGTVFKTHLLGHPTVVSMDPDLNKLLLSNEEKLVHASFPSFITNIVGPFLTVHGARHVRVRELANSVLSPAAIQSLHLIPVQDYARFVLRSWLHMPIVDAQKEVTELNISYIAKSFLSLEREDPRTELLVRDFCFLQHGFSAMPVNLPGNTYNKVLKARQRILTMFRGLVRGRRKVAATEAKDFMDALVRGTDECGKHFSEQEIVEIVYYVVFGGFETTSILLTNIMKFLSENPHVVDELRKEHTVIRKNKKPNELLSWDDVKQMQFTDLVIKETLRIASITHFVTREALQDIVFKDMVIPKGWKVLINFSMVHLNPSHYNEPLKFDPWRWKDTANNNHSLLMPFGGGARLCLGSYLAKFETSIFIHYLVTSYKWDRIMEVGGQRDVVSSLSFPTMKKGLPIKVEPLQTIL